MKRSMKTTIFCLLGLGLLLFNNCGQFEADSLSSATKFEEDVVVPIPIPRVDKSDFSVGDMITADKLSSFMTLAGDLASYSLASGLRAIAISTDGKLVFLHNHSKLLASYAEQIEINNAAIEICNFSSKQNCSILAEGMNFLKAKSNASSGGQMLASNPTTFNAAEIPGLPEAVKAFILDEYTSLAGAKALAVSVNGVYGVGSASITDSEAEAARKAVEKCQAASGGEACVLYTTSVGLKFTVANAFLAKPLPFSGALSANNIPFVSHSAIYPGANGDTTVFAEYKRAMDLGIKNIALFITDNGLWILDADDTISKVDLLTRALNDCMTDHMAAVNKMNNDNPTFNFPSLGKQKCHLIADDSGFLLSEMSLK